MKGVEYKPWPGRTRVPAQPQVPGRRRGVGTGREWKPRTAEYPALVICTGSAETHCMVCWILGKLNSKICKQVPTAGASGTKEKQVLFESLKGTGASQLDRSILANSA